MYYFNVALSMVYVRDFSNGIAVTIGGKLEARNFDAALEDVKALMRQMGVQHWTIQSLGLLEDNE